MFQFGVNKMYDAIRRIYGTPSIDIEIDDNAPWSRYTVTEKKEALSLYAKLGSFPEVEKELGISRSSVRLWHDRYNVKNVLKNVDDLYVSRVPNTRGANEINATDRQTQLLDFVKDKALVTNELVHLLNVTAATVRTDIKALLAKGKIKDISQNPRAKLVIAI
jgi:predicted HTH transcriptional regulator